MARADIRNRVWRFLLSAKDGDRMPLTQAEHDALGASAEEAVRAALVHETASGGEIQTVKH